MQVIKYIKEHGLEKLKEELHISVKEYEDRYVLNYNQIESPRFNPVVDECRGLVLDKYFNVLCRSFKRFYNYGEGLDKDKNGVRVPDFSEVVFKPLNIQDAKILHKMDGSLINIYYDGKDWCTSTRGMAFAEGENEFGTKFSDLVKHTPEYNTIMEAFNKDPMTQLATFIFELTSPFNRIVTPYQETHLTLLGAILKSHFKEEDGFEIPVETLVEIANEFKCPVPETYKINSWDDLIDLVNEFPSMQEGVVLRWDINEDGITNTFRLKCKNVQYVAIHNLRANGMISPYRILTLVMKNEQKEYLNYFPEDSRFFNFVEEEYKKMIEEIQNIYNEYSYIESQKEFALKIMSSLKDKSNSSFLFDMRKGASLEDSLKKFDGKRLSKKMNLKEKFIRNFNIKIDEDDDN